MTEQRLNAPAEMDAPNSSAEPVGARSKPQPNAAMARHLLKQAGPVYTAEHHAERREHLQQVAGQLGWQHPRDVLHQLAADYGISWAAIAKLIGVSPTAVRKWRRGEPVSSDSREALAGLLAFLQYAQSCQPIADLGRWLEMRVVSESWLTPIDLYAMGALDGLLDWLGGYVTVVEMLDVVDPEWRTKYARDSAYMVGDGPGGEKAIVPHQG